VTRAAPAPASDERDIALFMRFYRSLTPAQQQMQDAVLRDRDDTVRELFASSLCSLRGCAI